MDHRYYVRTQLRLPVGVYKQGRFMGRFETRDINLEGVFIEMQTGDLEPNDIVELIFRLPGGERCDCALFAGVVRIGVGGAGLMLFDHDAKTFAIMSHRLPRKLPAVS